LQLYGVGTILQSDEILQILKGGIDDGIIIVGVTQCGSGTVNLTTYEAGAALAKIGIVPGYDMTCEAAMTKLAFVLALPISPSEQKSLIARNIRGELSQQTDDVMVRSFVVKSNL